MKQEKSVRIITIIALFVCIIGFSVGFAAYTGTVNIAIFPIINPSQSNFKVEFSPIAEKPTNDIPEEIYEIKPEVSSPAVKANPILVKGNDIKGLYAEFTEPGQSVTYTFYAYNSGKYDAFLNSIAFSNPVNSNSPRMCVTNYNDDLSVYAVCQGISILIKVGDEAFTNSSIANVSNHILPKNDAEKIIVVIKYDKEAPDAKGPFKVYFGDVELFYSSVD